MSNDSPTAPRNFNETPIPDGVTHWQIRRVSGKDEKDAEYCTHPDSSGMLLRYFPVADLSTLTIRERWGGGKYRVNWFGIDENNTRKPMGRTSIFELQATEPIDDGALPASATNDPTALALRFAAQADARASAELERTIGIMQRLQATLGLASPASAPPAESAEIAELRREVQSLRMREAARAAAEEAVAPMRADLARRDARIAELERAAQERADTPDEDVFSPDRSIIETIVYSALNAAAKNPQIFSAVIAPIAERFIAASTPAPAPDPAPARPEQPAAFRPVVVPVRMADLGATPIEPAPMEKSS